MIILSYQEAHITTVYNSGIAQLWLIFKSLEELVVGAKKRLTNPKLGCQDRKEVFLEELAQCKQKG